MIETKHLLSRCELCDTDMIICATCGNNCCNGGYGKINGEPCKDCPDAYDVQDAYWENPSNIIFI